SRGHGVQIRQGTLFRDRRPSRPGRPDREILKPENSMLRIAATLALVMLFFSGAAARAEEYIDSYHADIAVAKDGVLTVTDTVRVNAEGHRIRRGIYRDFPLIFVGEDGRERQVGFDIDSVVRDGAAEPYRTETERRGVRIYFGS